jgi:hypothetical protein
MILHSQTGQAKTGTVRTEADNPVSNGRSRKRQSPECATPGCRDPHAENSRFCEIHRDELHRIRDELNGRRKKTEDARRQRAGEIRRARAKKAEETS